jgi:hypothetical protein
MNVDQDTYKCAVKRCEKGIVDASVRVRYNGSVLVLESDGIEQTPRGTIDSSETSIEIGACRLVRELTGVSCHVVDLASVNIIGIHDTSIPEREPIFLLSVLFDAVYDDGELRECATWNTSMPRVLALRKSDLEATHSD